MSKEEKMKICAYTFQRESATCKLFACSRCKETYYVSKEAQTSHWKEAHRFVCVSIANDDERVKNPLSSTQECLDVIYWCLEKPLERINGRLLLWAFRCLKWWRENRPNDFDIQRQLSPSTSFHFKLKAVQENYGHKAFQRIWAIPGWLDFFMSDELLLSKKAKELKKNGIPPPKPQIFHEETGAINPKTKLDPSLILDGFFCKTVTSLFMITPQESVEGNKKALAHNTALSSAVIRHSMKLWQCRYTSASFTGAGRNLIMTNGYFLASLSKRELMKEGKTCPFIKTNELVQGLTVMDLFEIMHWENGNFFTHFPYEHKVKFVMSLVEIDGPNQSSGPWGSLRPEDRVRLLELINQIEFFKIEPGFAIFVVCDKGTEKGFSDIKFAMMYLAMGHQSTKTMLEMHSAVAESDLGCPFAASQVKTNYGILMRHTKPKVASSVSLMEGLLKRKGYEGASFPEDLLSHVTEYAFPDSYDH
jgi:hypothetical protein